MGRFQDYPRGVPFRFIEADVCAADLRRYLRGIDVVNTFWRDYQRGRKVFEQHDQVEKVNFEGTKRVAESLLFARSELIALSTTSVYRDPAGSCG